MQLLQKSKKTRLENDKREKEAKRVALEELLQTWKPKVPCKKCTELQSQVDDLKKELREMEIIITSLREEVEFLEETESNDFPGKNYSILNRALLLSPLQFLLLHGLQSSYTLLQNIMIRAR